MAIAFLAITSVLKGQTILVFWPCSYIWEMSVKHQIPHHPEKHCSAPSIPSKWPFASSHFHSPSVRAKAHTHTLRHTQSPQQVTKKQLKTQFPAALGWAVHEQQPANQQGATNWCSWPAAATGLSPPWALTCADLGAGHSTGLGC